MYFSCTFFLCLLFEENVSKCELAVAPQQG